MSHIDTTKKYEGLKWVNMIQIKNIGYQNGSKQRIYEIVLVYSIVCTVLYCHEMHEDELRQALYAIVVYSYD